MGELHHIPDYWEDAKRHLCEADEVFADLIASYPQGCLHSKRDPFHTLARAIVGQQVSVASADAVWGKLEAAFGKDGRHVDAQTMAALDEEALIACGFSRQKRGYMRHLCAFFLDQHIDSIAYWDAMSDGEVIEHVTQIKGIGRWSAEMFLIFCLLRPDVWPLDDIGLQRALNLHYNVQAKPFDRASAERYGARFAPYRSVAVWYLWRSIDPNDVAY